MIEHAKHTIISVALSLIVFIGMMLQKLFAQTKSTIVDSIFGPLGALALAVIGLFAFYRAIVWLNKKREEEVIKREHLLKTMIREKNRIIAEKNSEILNLKGEINYLKSGK